MTYTEMIKRWKVQGYLLQLMQLMERDAGKDLPPLPMDRRVWPHIYQGA